VTSERRVHDLTVVISALSLMKIIRLYIVAGFVSQLVVRYVRA